MTETWQPSASIAALRRRSEILAHIREFFSQRKVMEVETPLLAPYSVTDVYLQSYAIEKPPQSVPLYLQTSPEFAMKRLLAAGSGPIYQLNKAFRQEEKGRQHRPEFTLLEWYQPGYDHHQLMQEVVQLVMGVVPNLQLVYVSYRKLFQDNLAINPHNVRLNDISPLMHKNGLGNLLEENDVTTCLQVLMSHVIEPTFPDNQLTFVYDYPVKQAALARIRADEIPVAERFEMYIGQIEIANGFHELCDAEEQRERFRQDQVMRCQHSMPPVAMDEKFLAALESGLPDCSGVALGVDRLIMAALELHDLAEVIAFANDY